MFYLRSGCYDRPLLQPSFDAMSLPLFGGGGTQAGPARFYFVTPSLNPSPRGEGLTIAFQALRR